MNKGQKTHHATTMAGIKNRNVPV